MPASFEPVIVPVDPDRMDAGLHKVRSKRSMVANPSASQSAGNSAEVKREWTKPSPESET